MAPKAQFYKRLLDETGASAKKDLRGRHGLDLPPPEVPAEEAPAEPEHPLEGADESMLEQLLSLFKSEPKLPSAHVSPHALRPLPGTLSHMSPDGASFAPGGTRTVPTEPGALTTIKKPSDSDIELLADLVPSKIHVNGKVSTPATREWMDQNDPEFEDRKRNAKIDRDAKEFEEEAG